MAHTYLGFIAYSDNVGSKDLPLYTKSMFLTPGWVKLQVFPNPEIFKAAQGCRLWQVVFY